MAASQRSRPNQSGARAAIAVQDESGRPAASFAYARFEVPFREKRAGVETLKRCGACTACVPNRLVQRSVCKSLWRSATHSGSYSVHTNCRLCCDGRRYCVGERGRDDSWDHLPAGRDELSHLAADDRACKTRPVRHCARRSLCVRHVGLALACLRLLHGPNKMASFTGRHNSNRHGECALGIL